MANPVPFSYYDRATDAMIGQIVDRLTFTMTRTLGAAVVTAGSVESEILDFLGRSLAGGRLVENFPEAFTQAHRDVGLAALRSLAQAYTHRRFRRAAGSYRIGDQRYAGGALYKALSRQDNVNAYARGFDFLDTALLDAEAKQWRRLNFGAGGGSVGGLSAPQEFQVEWAGLVVGVLGLPADPRPAFRIPRGYWFDAAGERVGAGQGRSGQFYYVGSPQIPEGRLGRPSPGRVTRGIASANFLDAGIRRIANELPRAYNTLFTDLYGRQLDKLESVGAAAGVSVPRPSEGEVTLIRKFHRGTIYR